MHEIEVKDWQQFLKLATHFDIESPLADTYIFRGQARADWLLIPSLVRSAQSARLDPVQALSIEAAATAEFQTQAHLHLPSQMIFDRKDLIAWWGLMQHYYAPTRLLDWTASPFVAAYFAIEREPDHPGAVWYFHCHTVDAYMRKTYEGYEFPKREKMEQVLLDSNAKDILYFGAARTQTDRMAAQQTKGALSTQILADHGQIMAKAVATGEAKKEMEVYGKLIIPKTLKPEFLRRLRSMNITARALFPGVDGLGRSVAELVRLGTAYESAKKKK